MDSWVNALVCAGRRKVIAVIKTQCSYLLCFLICNINIMKAAKTLTCLMQRITFLRVYCSTGIETIIKIMVVSLEKVCQDAEKINAQGSL